jgi:hypothetical protein
MELENIKRELAKHNKYSSLIAKLDEIFPPPRPFIFEAVFAYMSVKSNLDFRYEINITPNNNTTVDFVYGINDKYKLCFELLRPDLSAPLKVATEPQNTDIDGVKSWEVLLESNHPNEHLRPEAQTIRLQEKLLEKVEKFPEPSDYIFSTIVVDCTEFHFGHFDPDDCRMVMYGKTKVPELQEFWGKHPILGLLNPSLNKRQAEEFRIKVTSVIFIPEITDNLLNNSFLVLNHHRTEEHLQDFWRTISKYNFFHGLKYLPFPS